VIHFSHFDQQGNARLGVLNFEFYFRLSTSLSLKPHLSTSIATLVSHFSWLKNHLARGRASVPFLVFLLPENFFFFFLARNLKISLKKKGRKKFQCEEKCYVHERSAVGQQEKENLDLKNRSHLPTHTHAHAAIHTPEPEPEHTF
jgi:hypothetical protein